MTISAALGGVRLPFGYVVLNIDPILLRLGSLAIHWYGLAYVVAISFGLWAILRWTRRVGIGENQVWSIFLWVAVAGVVGGRLYFVIQQPDLVSNYLLKPINIIAVWNGGMAFFGAIFLGSLTLFFLAPRYGFDRFLALDGGAIFAMAGQIFGRFGNIINGDILGYATAQSVHVPAGVCATAPCVWYVPDPHILAWSIVYLNPGSFAAQGIPYQPAPAYEILMNLAILGLLWPVRLLLPRIRAGLLFTAYFALYGLSQIVVFFFRGSEPITPFLGVTIFKQAQWTGLAVMLLAIPLYFAVRRYSRPWTHSEERPVIWPPVAADGEEDADGAALTPALAGVGARASAASRASALKTPASKMASLPKAGNGTTGGPGGAAKTKSRKRRGRGGSGKRR
ncbi:MAG TPA: prolipoprotein diacylglyceryl transferase [Ktedonobacterales bacterium]|nr:prolipoprotein diacylglyceryl transferase [Ktedonobacterales bacterium]